MNRRQFLTRTSCTFGALALPTIPGSNARPQKTLEDTARQTTQYKGKSREEYTLLSNRYKQQSGQRTVRVEFSIETNAWKDILKKDLSKKQFYKRLKQAPFQQVTETVFKGFYPVHPGPIHSKDIIDEFMEAIEGKKRYELEPDLNLTRKDKETLKTLLEKNIQSTITDKVVPFTAVGTVASFLGAKPEPIEVYLFPPKSRIEITKGQGNPSIVIYTNENPNWDEKPIFGKPVENSIDNPEKAEIFRKLLQHSLLANDPKAEKRDKQKNKPRNKFVPIDYLYGVYEQERKR